MIRYFFCLVTLALIAFLVPNQAHARGGFGGFHAGGFHAGGFHAGSIGGVSGFHAGGFHAGGYGPHYHPSVGYYHPYHPVARAAVAGAAYGAAASAAAYPYGYPPYPYPYPNAYPRPAY